MGRSLSQNPLFSMKQAVFTKYRLTIDHQKATFTKILMSIITRGKHLDLVNVSPSSRNIIPANISGFTVSVVIVRRA